MLSNQRKSIAAESVTDGMGRPLSRCGAGVAIFSDFSSPPDVRPLILEQFKSKFDRNSTQRRNRTSFAWEVQRTPAVNVPFRNSGRKSSKRPIFHMKSVDWASICHVIRHFKRKSNLAHSFFLKKEEAPPPSVLEHTDAFQRGHLV